MGHIHIMNFINAIQKAIHNEMRVCVGKLHTVHFSEFVA